MKHILAALLLIGVSTSATPSFAFGFLGHVAAYAAGSVAAHEAERYIDHRHERRQNESNSDRNEPSRHRSDEQHKAQADKPNTQSTTMQPNPFYKGA